MKTLTHIQTRIFDTPLAIQPKKLEIILAAIGERIGLQVSAEALAATANYTPAAPRNFDVVGNVAIIPVQGTLMKTTSGLMAASGCSSYEDITAAFQLAMESPDVSAVVLDVDSPGGEVHGMFELSDLIYSSRGAKPIIATANDSAFSAAYAIASAADTVYVTRTGGVGSVGVFCLHVDQSAADAKQGLRYTYIHAGAKKTDGNPHEPLTETAQEDAQAEVDREYGLFCQLVSRNRGESIQAVIKTEAGTYFADGAVPLLVDKVGTMEDILMSLTQQTAVLNTTVGKTTGNRPMNKTLVAKAADEYQKEADVAEAEADEACDKAEDEKEEAEDAKEAEAEVPAKEPEQYNKEDEDEDGPNKAGLVRIINLCTLAGQPSLAATYINAGMDVKQVEKALLEKRAMESKNTKLDTTLTAKAGAFDTLNGLAKEVKRNKGIKKSDAYAQMLTSNADAYMSYLEERDEACGKGLNSRSTRNYLAEMEGKVRGN